MRVLALLLYFLSASAHASSPTAECLGEKTASRAMVYLHGLEALAKQSSEEKQNRDILKKLARELDLRIALPEGPVCPKNRRCWPAKDTGEITSTFAWITKAIGQCFVDKDYSLLGFSNGGYFAFKIYKTHTDIRLKKIIAAGSSGLWDPSIEKTNPLSEFHLIIGDKDLTSRNAEGFMERFRKADPTSTISVFKGGHRLDYDSLKKILSAPGKK